MAKQRVNKAAEIRKYLQKNKDAKPAEVVQALKERRITVTAQQVSTTKNQWKKKVQKAKPKSRPRLSRSQADRPQPMVCIDDVRMAKKFVAQIGGVEKAQTAISCLEVAMQD